MGFIVADYFKGCGDHCVVSMELNFGDDGRATWATSSNPIKSTDKLSFGDGYEFSYRLDAWSLWKEVDNEDPSYPYSIIFIPKNKIEETSSKSGQGSMIVTFELLEDYVISQVPKEERQIPFRNLQYHIAPMGTYYYIANSGLEEGDYHPYTVLFANKNNDITKNTSKIPQIDLPPLGKNQVTLPDLNLYPEPYRSLLKEIGIIQ
jgi:hypothetical protein